MKRHQQEPGGSRSPIFLGGRNDRATIACVRSLRKADVDFRISLPRTRKLYDPYNLIWKLTPYRNCISDLNYSPPETPNMFIKSIIEMSADLGDCYIFPIGEKEIQTILENREELNSSGIVIPLPSKDKYKTLTNKLSFVNTCNSNGLNIPNRLTFDEASKNFPFVAKPKTNINKTGDKLTPYLIFSEEDLERFEDVENKSDFFFQEFVSGDSFYYCTLWNSGSLEMSFSQKTITQQPNGKSVIKAAPANIDDDVKLRTNQMLKEMDWHGPIMFEFKKCSSSYYAIEANPRFWGPLQLAVDNGVDFPAALHELVTGEAIRQLPIRRERRGYRWSIGYLNGIWMKVFEGGKFSTSPSRDCKYRDVWVRKDTIHNFFLYDLLGQGLTPASVILYERR